MSIRSVLSSAFDFLFDMEAQMNDLCDKMGDATPEELEQYMEEFGTIQELLTAHDFYLIDSKVDEVGRALGLSDIGLERDVTDLSGGQRTKVLLGKLLLEKPDILILVRQPIVVYLYLINEFDYLYFLRSLQFLLKQSYEEF